MYQVRSNLSQGIKDKSPLSQPGMGDNQLGSIYNLVAIKKNIYILSNN